LGLNNFVEKNIPAALKKYCLKNRFKELRVVEKLMRLNRYVRNSYERRIAVENNY
jgi:hypothetical protein